MQKFLNIVCGICVIAAILAILSCTCTQNSVVANVEVTQDKGPITPDAWAKVVNDTWNKQRKCENGNTDYTLIRVVEVSDGHDYVMSWISDDGISITHAAGCRKCTGAAEKAPPSPITP